MNSLLIAGLTMIVLHRPDGGEVVIAPAHVAGLHAKPPPIDDKNKLFVPTARCVVWLDSGKWIAVLETCGMIKKLLEE